MGVILYIYMKKQYNHVDMRFSRQESTSFILSLFPAFRRYLNLLDNGGLVVMVPVRVQPSRPRALLLAAAYCVSNYSDCEECPSIVISIRSA